MALERYREKRDFQRTPEPRGGKRGARSAAPMFVVQKHAASHLHYDFRLEEGGVLLSWAIPKGPSLDPRDKRLAMHVEDHPLEYGGFEGIIPRGEYGGGTVMVWDRGTWQPHGDPAAGLAQGVLKFSLDGEKLKGGFALVRTRGSKYGGKSGDAAWLLIKEKDVHARTDGVAVVDAAPDSVLTGRSLDAIAAAGSRVWRPRRSVKANVQSGAIAPTPTKRKAAKSAAREPTAAGVRARLPAMLSPVLATLVTRAPDDAGWVNEIKYDGYRMLCRVQGGRARLYSRNGRDWTRQFPTVARDVAALPVRSAWIDGEMTVQDAQGRTSFQALQQALSGGSADFTFFVFDLPYADGRDLRAVPLEERKRLLRALVGPGAGAVRLGPEVRGGGVDFHRQACGLGLEGIVCKKADSRYADGARSREWLKVKCGKRQELVIGGYTEPQGSREGFGALLLGHFEKGAFRYAGRVGTGFDDALLRKLVTQLRALETKTPAFANPPKGAAARGVHWVRPHLVAEVAFTEWSRDGALRHPSFLGLRLDKKAAEIRREEAVPTQSAVPLKAGTRVLRPASGIAAASAGAVAGVMLSHADKPFFPEAGVTKGDLAAFYAAVAPHLLPHIADRPLSLLRCPDGWSGECFYQKKADRSVHSAVQRVEVPTSAGAATYLRADSAAALAGLVQWGVIELHPWGSRIPRLDRPDRLIFDFDPDESIAWKTMVEAVQLLRTLLDEMKLTGFLKTTGGKGLHVVVPIRPTLSWDEAKAFTRSVADFLVRTFPDRFVAQATKARRTGRIFVDYLRNAEGATAVAPYSVRARANAPVATPIEWDELATDLRFDHFNVATVRERLGRRADPWRTFFTVRQQVTIAMRRRLG